jgi:uncharacterized lipoprotein YajG
MKRIENLAIPFGISVAILLLAGCQTNPSQPAAAEQTASPADTRPCAQNFKVNGSMVSFSGKSYQNQMSMTGVNQKTAIERAGKAIAIEGMTVVSMDKEAGFISASNAVTMGKGATAPFAVSVDQGKNAVNVTMKFQTAFGQIASEDSVKEFFCKIATAIKGS